MGVGKVGSIVVHNVGSSRRKMSRDVCVRTQKGRNAQGTCNMEHELGECKLGRHLCTLLGPPPSVRSNQKVGVYLMYVECVGPENYGIVGNSHRADEPLGCKFCMQFVHIFEFSRSSTRVPY